MQNQYILRRSHPAAAKRRRDGIFLYVLILHLCCIYVAFHIYCAFHISHLFCISECVNCFCKAGQPNRLDTSSIGCLGYSRKAVLSRILTRRRQLDTATPSFKQHTTNVNICLKHVKIAKCRFSAKHKNKPQTNKTNTCTE